MPPPNETASIPRGEIRKPRNATEQRIIDAAHRVMSEHGLIGATTKRIAAEAEVAEGTIYRYFDRKADLFHEVLWRVPSEFLHLVRQLPQKVNSGSIRETLIGIAVAAIAFFREVMALSMGVFAKPSLQAELADAMRERNVGPHMPNLMLATYIRAEQDAGRIESAVDPDGMAYALLGGCFQHAFHASFFQDDIDEPRRRVLATALVSALALPA